MREIILSSRFKRDYKLAGKRRLRLELLDRAIQMLSEGVALPPRYRPHQLRGEYAGFMECHIEPDWLLIYEVTEDTLKLVRTGTHSDLFDE